MRQALLNKGILLWRLEGNGTLAMVSTSSQPPGPRKKSPSVGLTDSMKEVELLAPLKETVHRVGRRSQRAVWAAPSA